MGDQRAEERERLPAPASICRCGGCWRLLAAAARTARVGQFLSPAVQLVQAFRTDPSSSLGVPSRCQPRSLDIYPASSLLLSSFFQHCFSCVIISTAGGARGVFLVYKMLQIDCDLVAHTCKPSTPDSSSSSFTLPPSSLSLCFSSFFLPSLPSPPFFCSSSSSRLDYDGYSYWRMLRQ